MSNGAPPCHQKFRDMGALIGFTLHFGSIVKLGADLARRLNLPTGRGRKHQTEGLALLLLIVGLIINYRGTSRRHDLTEHITAQFLDRATTAELEIAKMQPRRLSSDQPKSSSALFAKFPGSAVHVSSYMQDVDASMLGEQILQAAPMPNLRRTTKGWG